MAIVTITNAASPISEEEIVKFETRCGIELPYSYKAFLLKANGGVPMPDRLIVPGWHGRSTCITNFFGLVESGKYDLESSLQNAEDYIPKFFIPIAEDTGGNMLCLGTQNNHTGKVFFWDHQRSNGQDPSNLYEVAKDIDDLLSILV